MSRIPALARLIVIPLGAAVLLSAQLAFVAVAWTSYCPQNGICIWQNRDFGGYEAGTPGDVPVYSGYYPMSSVPINDSASSAYNNSLLYDVYFHNEPSYDGAMFCADTNHAYSWVGLFNNDAWSSHNFTSGDTACS
jgi:Peptidase inhibitor family I36